MSPTIRVALYFRKHKRTLMEEKMASQHPSSSAIISYKFRIRIYIFIYIKLHMRAPPVRRGGRRAHNTGNLRDAASHVAYVVWFMLYDESAICTQKNKWSRRALYVRRGRVISIVSKGHL
eukprot:GEMP01076114.1.p1 GENE.GEMP01076114.1~~GEMP01076114.1.p1  ORF type:complete len:120 (-),score=5.13 GEMP01076114.1:195-554(-)